MMKPSLSPTPSPPEVTQNTVRIPLSSLDPDVDGNGNVSRAERKIHGCLLAADKDGNGWLSIKEFYSVLLGFLSAEKSRALYKKLAIFSLIGCFILACTTLGTSTAAAVLAKESYVSETLMVDANGKVVAVAKAETSLPLLVAPVLSSEQLASIEKMSVTYKSDVASDGGEEQTVQASLSVSHVKRFSKTRVTFELAFPGGLVQVWDGAATYTDAEAIQHNLCFAKVGCAAFSVDDAGEAEKLVAEAEAALAAAGLEGRRLDGNDCADGDSNALKCKDFCAEGLLRGFFSVEMIPRGRSSVVTPYVPYLPS